MLYIDIKIITKYTLVLKVKDIGIKKHREERVRMTINYPKQHDNQLSKAAK